jgi:cytochrome c5
MRTKQRWNLIIGASMIFSITPIWASDVPVQAVRVQSLYKTYCDACHGTGKQGAPMPGKIADWGERLMVGVDGLLDATKKGLKNMPVKGGCNECSDAELQALIEWMSEDREAGK